MQSFELSLGWSVEGLVEKSICGSTQVTTRVENIGRHYLKRVWTFHVREGWMRVGKKCRETEGCCERISSLGCDLNDLELGV